MTVLLVIIGCTVALFALTVFFGAPYVPSHSRRVRQLFDELKLGPEDTLVDIGSGDGRVLRLAAARGARAVGYEINPVLVLISRLLHRRSQVRWANFWTASMPSEVTVVYAFSVNRDRKRLVRKVQEEATRAQRSITLICYGSPLADRTPDREIGAFSVYSFRPLQPPKAQV